MKKFLFVNIFGLVIAFSLFAQEQKPDLWLLTIGINRYYNVPKRQHLRFAKQNIKAITDSFNLQQGEVFNAVHILQVLDDTAIPPTYENISENLKFLKQAKQNDVAIVYYSGHGDIDKTNGRYYLLPSDLEFHNDGTVDFLTAISMDMIKSNLNSTATNILFIESCYSSAAIKELGNQNTIIFASSLENEDTHEVWQLSRDGFNYAVSEGMSGKAAESGIMTAESLSRYIQNKLIELAQEGMIPKDQQHPVTYIPEGLRGFVLGRY
jgi:hypothetical protein